MRAFEKFSRSRGLAPLLGAGLLACALLPAAAQDTAPAPQVEPPAALGAEAPPAPAPLAPAPAMPELTAPAAGTPEAAPAAPGLPTPPPDQAETGVPGAPEAGAPETALPAPDLPGAPPLAPGAQATLPHDLSPWGMFMAADRVVKGVMIGLALASFITWTVWLAKTLEIMGSRGRMRKARAILNRCADLEDARRGFADRRGVVAVMVRATAEESRASAGALPRSGGDGLKDRVASHLSRIEAEAGRRMTRGTSILATIGSVAPFVGLFGTVWGIMNSFIGISQSQTTNLAVVAPGIAEALLATAMGLVAAIPAVVIYNHFARSITSYRQELADISANLERMVSRDIDHGRLRAFDLAAE